MAKHLVIVESPAKAKTINKYLGNDYVVKSSVGHIRDLPTNAAAMPKDEAEPAKAKKAKKSPKKEKLAPEETARLSDEKLFKRMGIYPNKDWAADYVILPGKEKVLKELKGWSEKTSTIFLATDLDREGEAIAWHLAEAIGGDKARFKRVTFTEITQKAIQEAFESPTDINMNMVNSQQARRFLDRVVGYTLSPLLWARVARGLSAGRVQSVAVRLISEREKEIHAFKPEEYWDVFVDLRVDPSDSSPNIKVQCTKVDGAGFRPESAADATKAVYVLQSSPHRLVKREDKPTQGKPSAPFITSTLQQAASVKLGFGVKKTMMLAQRLYEEGLITYMRTDSTNLSVDAVAACRAYINTNFGSAYLPSEPQSYSSKKGAQEAHEAIRPSDVQATPDSLEASLEKDSMRLYDLIWRQFVACQMMPATYDSTSLVFQCEAYELRARGRVMRFDGFLRVQPLAKKKGEDDVNLPDIKEGAVLSAKAVTPSQHFTKPPPRYTEASLVKELEKSGIGRPSTYAAIISTIQDRGYVLSEKRRFYCLKMGEIVTDRLVESFQDLMGYDFTAHMEQDLDGIAEGSKQWRQVLNRFYEDFVKKVQDASVHMRANLPTLTAIQCPECQRPMAIRTARTGVFLSCSGYALPVKERCKGTINLVAGEEAIAADVNDDDRDLLELQLKHRCPKCETAMDSYLVDEDRKLHVCGNNPDCDGYEIEPGKFKIKGYEGPSIECDKCSHTMELRTGRFGKYFACTNAPTCKNTRKLMRNGEAAPPRCDAIPMPELKCETSDGYFVLRDGAAGIFLASNQFPKSRETKKPRVNDLIRHKEAIDPKYEYLLRAPSKDPRGNEAVIRFSRKTKEHYVMSEEDGKATGWSAFYENGAWREELVERQTKKAE